MQDQPNRQPDRQPAAPSSRPLELPAIEDLVAELHRAASTQEPIARYLQAAKSGTFVHPDGRRDALGLVVIQPEASALLAHLCRICAHELTVEIGFGMGSSATVILATRRAAARPFRHVIVDPWGLDQGRGAVVQSYLAQEFGHKFERLHERSEIGLGSLLKQAGAGTAGLIFIDGGHHFETVMTDFALADLLCAMDGYIVFDDANAPAIETVVNYIEANRPDYRIAWLPVSNTAVIQKARPDDRQWDSFHPFAVPDRHDWTLAGAAAAD